jgi:hypothetical protein
LGKHVASIFSIEEYAKQGECGKQNVFATCLLLAACLIYSSTMIIEAVYSPKYPWTCTELQRIESQKRVLFVITAVRTSNATSYKPDRSIEFLIPLKCQGGKMEERNKSRVGEVHRKMK